MRCVRAPVMRAPVRCHRVAPPRVRRFTSASKADEARQKVVDDLVAAKERYTSNRGEWRELVQAMLRFGVSMEESARHQEAEECYREAHRLANYHDPSDAATALLVGNALRNQGRFGDAQTFYSETIAKLDTKPAKGMADWSVLGHAWEGRAKCVVLQEDVPAAIPAIETSLQALKRGLPIPYAESAHEWVKFLMGVFERPHLRSLPRIGDLKLAEAICKDAITVLEKEASADVAPDAPQMLLDATVDLSTIKSDQHEFAEAETQIDKAYEVWRLRVKPIVSDAGERDIMEMQMRLLTARRSHANSANAATEYRKAVGDYVSAIRLGESKDNPLKKPAFDLLATAHVGLGHLRLELGWPKHGDNNAEAAKHFDTVRSLQRTMLTVPDPLTISASFITKRVQLAKQQENYTLRLELLSRREEPVFTQLSLRGTNVDVAQVVEAGKELKVEVADVKLGEQNTETHFQEIVVQVYTDQSKQRKLIDVHREFVITT